MVKVEQIYIPLHRSVDFDSSTHSKLPLDVAAKRYTRGDDSENQFDGATAIFLHGTGFPKELYEPTIDELLRTSIDVAWAYDAVTMGESYRINMHRLEDKVTYEDFARHLCEVVEWIQGRTPGKRCSHYVVGHSLGGAIALYSLELGLQVEGALVIEPVITHPLEATPEWVGGLIASTKNRTSSWATRSDAIEYFSRQPLYAEWDSSVLERFLIYGLRENNGRIDLVTPIQRELQIYQGDNVSPSKIYSGLGSIKVPLAFLGGKESLICPPQKLIDMAARCMNSLVHVIPNSGHLVPFTHPEETKLAIEAFIQGFRTH